MLEMQNIPLRTVVVGLGQVGSRFDEDPGRTVVWSHTGAYLTLPERFALAAAVEISPTNAAAFSVRCPGVPVYGDIEAIIERHRPQVASICTPAETHSDVLFKLLACPDLRLIWCEKPLSVDVDEAARMVETCRQRGVALMVSFNRRMLPLWQRARSLIEGGAIGTVRSVRVALPNRLFSIGSHAVDLALFLGGEIDEIVALSIPALAESGEPAVSAMLRYRSGAGGVIQVTGMKAQLIVEAEAIGDDGRMSIREDKNIIALERFMPSTRFQGYRELVDLSQETVNEPVGFSPFTAMAENAGAHLNQRAPLICDGNSALEVQHLLELMRPKS